MPFIDWFSLSRCSSLAPPTFLHRLRQRTPAPSSVLYSLSFWESSPSSCKTFLPRPLVGLSCLACPAADWLLHDAPPLPARRGRDCREVSNPLCPTLCQARLTSSTVENSLRTNVLGVSVPTSIGPHAPLYGPTGCVPGAVPRAHTEKRSIGSPYMWGLPNLQGRFYLALWSVC